MSNDTVITPTNNGSYRVRGDFKIVLPSGTELDAAGKPGCAGAAPPTTSRSVTAATRRIGFRATETDVAEEHIAGPVHEVALTA